MASPASDTKRRTPWHDFRRVNRPKVLVRKYTVGRASWWLVRPTKDDASTKWFSSWQEAIEYATSITS